jgi:hypothetical protein
MSSAYICIEDALHDWLGFPPNSARAQLFAEADHQRRMLAH